MNHRVAPGGEFASARSLAPAAARRRWWPFRRPSRFVSGVLVGMLALQGVRALVDSTDAIDSVLAPVLPMDTGGSGDVIVVLGAGVNKRCVPNNYAIQRLLTASRAYAEGRAPLVLITGGRPRGVTCSVAGAMKDLAIKFGIPADRIRLENAARNTWQNALYSDPILRQLGARRLVLVTDRLHMKRAEGCFRALGFDTERVAVHSPDSHPNNMSMLGFAGREVVGLAYYWLRGRVSFETTVHAAPAAGGASARPASPAESEAARLTRHPDGPLVVLGASYAAGWQPVLPAVRVVNKGRSGQQTFELRARFAEDVASQRPRAVLIWGFINDVFRAPRDGVEAASMRARREVEAIAAAARAEGIEPILATEVTIRGRASWSDWFASWAGWALGKTSYDAYINAHVLRHDAWLREYARREGLLLLDFQNVLADTGGTRRAEFAQDDGSHLTAQAYAAIDRYAIPILQAHFSGAAAPAAPVSPRR